MHEDDEKIFFLIKSKTDEYCFTNLALIHVDGTSAVSKKRLVKRFDYYRHKISHVMIETAGTVDLDCELKFMIGNEEFSIDVDRNQLEQLKDIYKHSSLDRKNKSPIINLVVSLYTTFVLDEPIHPIGTPFPGSLEVIMENGVYYCPVKEANMDTPNSVCRLCIAEQLDF